MLSHLLTIYLLKCFVTSYTILYFCIGIGTINYISYNYFNLEYLSIIIYLIDSFIYLADSNRHVCQYKLQ